MGYKNTVLNVIARRYNEKWRLPNYDCAIKKLQCHHIHSFLSCNPQNFDGIIHDYDVPVYICKFSLSPFEQHVLAVANENGTVCIENVERSSPRTYVQTHNNTVFDLAWMPGKKNFVTVSGDHSAKLWDCGESDIKMVSEFLGHTRSVKCVSFKPENTSVFATGSRDGSLIIWDARSSRKCSKLPVSHIPDQIIPSAAGTSPHLPKRKYYPMEASQSNSVTGLIFQNDNTLISCGSSDQYIRVWDMRKTYSRSVSLPISKYQLCAPSTGFSHICIDPSTTKIYGNCMDSYIYCFDINSYQQDPISAFYGHQNGSFYVKSSVSHDGMYLLSGSSDKVAYIWNTRHAELSEVGIKPIVTLPGHTAEVASVVMSLSGDMKVATCSDDGTYRLWYNYELKDTKGKHREGEHVDAAEIVDSDHLNPVRTQWKNKRKRTASEDNSISVNVVQRYTPEGQVFCTFHTKICRYYTNNLITASEACRCQHQLGNPTCAMKRLGDKDNDKEFNLKKRRTQLEMQEHTPPKSNEVKTVNRVLLHDLRSPMRTSSSVKKSLKRKLSSLPNFIDDEECKRKANERILLPISDLKDNCETELHGVSFMNELQGTEFQSIKSSGSQCDSDDVLTYQLEDWSEKNEFSSPTSNLPNYVKDGTSPYLHRCSRTQKENLDWLTKLRKSISRNIKNVEVAKIMESKEESPKSHGMKCDGKTLQHVTAKRKLVRSNSGEGRSVHQTLHKYFKVSNKPTESGYLVGRESEKNVLA